MTKLTKKDIERNLELVKKGKSLDIPLSILNGKLKNKSFFYSCAWTKDNRIRKNSNIAFRKYKKNKKRLRYKVEWCLWFLYYYKKYMEKGGKNGKKKKVCKRL